MCEYTAFTDTVFRGFAVWVHCVYWYRFKILEILLCEYTVFTDTVLKH